MAALFMETPYMVNPYNHSVIASVVGGTGGNMLMKGFRPHAVHPVALCSVCDFGGSTGRIRRAYPGVIAIGDIRNCAEALMGEEFSILSNRLSEGDGDSELSKQFADHHVLNMVYLGELLRTKDQIAAIAKVNKFLRLQGEVWPMSPEPAHLVGTFSDDTFMTGEDLIDTRPLTDERKLVRVALDRRLHISKPAREAFLKARLITFGPGDLYTSIVPSLLPDGVSEAIAESKAKTVYILNLMTKYSETRGFMPVDFLSALKEYRLGREKFDTILVNSRQIPDSVAERYRAEEKAEPVVYETWMEQGLREFAHNVRPLDLLDDGHLKKEGLVRHDSVKLAANLVALSKWCEA